MFNPGVDSTDSLFDLNSDNMVDAADLTEWSSPASSENGRGSPYLRGDTDPDCDVDPTDYNALASNFKPFGYRAAAVVEPASVCLLLPALLAVVVASPNPRQCGEAFSLVLPGLELNPRDGLAKQTA